MFVQTTRFEMHDIPTHSLIWCHTVKTSFIILLYQTMYNTYVRALIFIYIFSDFNAVVRSLLMIKFSVTYFCFLLQICIYYRRFHLYSLTTIVACQVYLIFSQSFFFTATRHVFLSVFCSLSFFFYIYVHI